eukprot:TRINITY_DN16730_c0_g1_i2.p1 TRINITY_DN16730_c0_g1~~TRINITY_DN16730_c0_g1_i2.p1  ORF type:complete len:268 (-),score=44.79 TRINITY_DN16730_c0_g1_i2:32-835(-)
MCIRDRIRDMNKEIIELTRRLEQALQRGAAHEVTFDNDGMRNVFSCLNMEEELFRSEELGARIAKLERELKAAQEIADKYSEKLKEAFNQLEDENKERNSLKQKCELLTIQLEESHSNYELLQEENAKIGSLLKQRISAQPSKCRDLKCDHQFLLTIDDIGKLSEDKVHMFYRQYREVLDENKRLKDKFEQLTEHEINLINQNNELDNAVQSYKKLYENERKLSKDLRAKVKFVEQDIRLLTARNENKEQDNQMKVLQPKDSNTHAY